MFDARCDHSSRLKRLTRVQSYHRECIWQTSHDPLPASIVQCPPVPTAPVPHFQTVRPHFRPLQRHIPDGQHPGHIQIHSPEQAGRNRHERSSEIHRNKHRQLELVSLQGQPVHQDLRRRIASPYPASHLRLVCRARLPHDLRVVQLAADDRAVSPSDGRDGALRFTRFYGAVPRAGCDPAHLDAFPSHGPRLVQSQRRHDAQAALLQGQSGLAYQQFCAHVSDRACVWCWRRGEQELQR
jgi:hypothetical protein